MCKLKKVSDKGVIFSNISNLAGKKNAKKKLFVVKDHLLEEENEIRSYYQDLRKHNKDKDEDDRIEIKLKKNRIFIDGKKFIPAIKPAKNSDILRLSPEEKEQIRQMKTVQGDSLAEKGSTFYSAAAKATSIADVDRAYKRMRDEI